MIKLKDFLEIINDNMKIKRNREEVIMVNHNYKDCDLLSDKLLNSEIDEVESESNTIIVYLKEDICND